jgi:hypothetical protein
MKALMILPRQECELLAGGQVGQHFGNVAAAQPPLSLEEIGRIAPALSCGTGLA